MHIFTCVHYTLILVHTYTAHVYTHSHAHKYCFHIHTLAHTHTHTHSHTLTHIHILTHTHSLSHTLTLTHTHILTHTHSLSHTLTHSLTHTHSLGFGRMDEQAAMFILKKVITHFISIATEQAKTLPDDNGMWESSCSGVLQLSVYTSRCIHSCLAWLSICSSYTYDIHIYATV